MALYYMFNKSDPAKSPPLLSIGVIKIVIRVDISCSYLKLKSIWPEARSEFEREVTSPLFH